MTKPLIDLSKNTKQSQYFNEVMRSVAGLSPNRIFSYGGAVRGGKTYCTLFILMLLARKFPKSRWHVIRKDMPALLATTIPSFEKLCPPGPGAKYSRNPANYYVEFPNGSKIFFKGENLSQDKELKDFLGLETNGIFLEQTEELSERLFQKALERTGSWYIDPMPPGLVFMTFNPTDNWPRQKIYEPYKAGTLAPPYLFIEALPSDNPFVTADQWAAWELMDDISKRRFIHGDWDARRSGSEFYHAFSRTMHIRQVEFDPTLPVHLSFDQNVVPYVTMTCWQVTYDDERRLVLRAFDEYCLENPHNTTGALCERFIADYGSQVASVFYYGDASGNKRDTRQKQSDYDIIRQHFRKYINTGSNRVKKANPNVIRRREFINFILEGRWPALIEVDGDRCRNLTADLFNLKQDANGKKLKEHATDPDSGVRFEKYGHTSDTMDYFVTSVLFQYFQKFLKAGIKGLTSHE